MDYLPTTDDFNLALLLLRVVVGPTFAFHGFAKIFRGGRLTGTAGWFDSLGMRPGEVHARLAAGSELATGICLTLGLVTSFAGMGMVGLMAVAFWTVHRGHGLLVFANGWEYNLVLGVVGVTVATLGAGRWSLDNAIGIDLNGAAGAAISFGGGLLLAWLVLAMSFHPPTAEAEADTQAADADETEAEADDEAEGDTEADADDDDSDDIDAAEADDETDDDSDDIEATDTAEANAGSDH